MTRKIQESVGHTVAMAVLVLACVGIAAENPNTLLATTSNASTTSFLSQPESLRVGISSTGRNVSLHEEWYFRETDSDLVSVPGSPGSFTNREDVILCHNNEAVYVGRPQGLVSKLNATNGAVLWTARVGGKATQAVLVGDHIEVTIVQGASTRKFNAKCLFLMTQRGELIRTKSPTS